MSKMSSRETWATIGLGAVCVFLVARLVIDSASVSAKNETPEVPRRASTVRVVRTRVKAAADFPQTPVLHLNLLKHEDAEPLLASDRNPFQFAPTPEQVRQALAQKAAAAGGAAAGPPPPPTAPPVPYKALGFSENEHGQFTAYLTDDKDIFVLRVGDDLAKRYKILQITPNLVEVRDESFNQTSQLLFPQ